MSGKRTEIKTPEWTVTLIPRTYESSGQWYANTRVYDAVNTFAPLDGEAYGDALWAGKADDAELRKLSRAATSKARVGLLAALKVIEPHWDVNFRDLDGKTFPAAESLKPSFSRKAGCSCGCLPGYVLDDRIRVNGEPVDMWFRVTPKPVMEISKKDLAQAVFHSLTELDAIKRELGV